MLRLSDMARLGRAVRQDDLEDLGRPTPHLIEDAIDDGRDADAKALAQYTVPEGKSLHDLFCDWLWDLFTRIADRHFILEKGANAWTGTTEALMADAGIMHRYMGV